MLLRSACAAAAAVLLSACTAPTIRDPSPAHLRADNADNRAGTIPPPVQQSVALPPPRATARTETYSVVVNGVRVHDLLFALARDAKINVDIHPGISGSVTLNAIDQTLPQLLKRIASQVDMRFELDGANLVVMPDTPYLKNYKVDYVNMSRDTTGTVAVTTQVASGTPGTGTGGTATATASANNSITRIENKAQNHFWEKLEQNIKDILRETDKILPEGTSETVVEQNNAQSTTGTGANPAALGGRNATSIPSLASSPNPATLQNSGTTVVRRSTFREAASVIANAESGVITVRATARQHEKVQEFIDQVMQSVKRQVLIEATIAEVKLSQNYQQGIDWSAKTLGRAGFNVSQGVETSSTNGSISAPASSLFQLSYQNAASRLGNISAAVKLLDAFGTVKVLSSPKLSVLNNQTAVLKVVDNRVYFTLKADTTANTNTTTTTFTTTLQSVPVGFVMNVTPQVGEGDSVMLNIRPSISSIIDWVNDPNPSLKNPCGFNITETCKIDAIESKIPVIRTREMESVMRVENGNIAVMGGLIEDRIDYVDNAIPGVSRIPYVGELFKQRNDTTTKTELVVFLRPIVLKDASIDGDFGEMRRFLPKDDFFTSTPQPGAAR
ncbi:pilus (MSHA type) biogenesis protein MshL [Rhodocyclus tenuis]|uniref:pilus (MSHA type) biogenesis protein MshL n=1 Tax=Rhodocyclus tenuis TaxID=1066 RepID=UPI001902EDDC|nr:pilus (MSHA type) biogenesis protein MshL [Rhodocyclus tenuis]MBK1680207.1 pilus (MSHA type) biogenesis protein MshL [Rhodocyclus tenuis]